MAGSIIQVRLENESRVWLNRLGASLKSTTEGSVTAQARDTVGNMNTYRVLPAGSAQGKHLGGVGFRG